jgi:hypothetical protein
MARSELISWRESFSSLDPLVGSRSLSRRDVALGIAAQELALARAGASSFLDPASTIVSLWLDCPPGSHF